MKFKELIQIIKNYIKDNEIKLINWCMGINFVFCILLTTLFFLFLIFFQLDKILQNNSFFINILKLVLMFYLILFFIWYLCKRYQKEDNNKFLEKIIQFLNPYILLFLILFYAIILMGNYFIIQNYGNNLPVEKDLQLVATGNFNNYLNNLTKNITFCDSVRDNDYLVFPDKLKCSTNFKFKTNEIYVSKTEIYKISSNDTEEFLDSILWIKNNDTKIIIYLNIGDKEYKDYKIKYYFMDNSTNEEKYLYYLNFRGQPITYIEASELKTKRATYFFGLLSIAFFSLLAGIRNLRYLLEEKI